MFSCGLVEIRIKLFTTFPVKVKWSFGLLQMVSEPSLQQSDLMDSLAFRYVVNFVNWRQDFMFTYWYAYYRTNNVFKL